MDFAPMLKQVIDFVIYFLGKEFVFAGYRTSIGAVFIWSALALFLIGVVRRLSE